ncbi:RNA-binding protein [Rothia sp. ZJ932]|uniref:RNA-binding protein n=1 Tax=Rothia sp. ZJ932 TaxID=2810516 RepID=UPI001966DD1A|nr:RNA-binding protein [Rothia sp. ZJ932]QRZ61204.1 RNA-binding protein [Rothia sp. ZJ932]
MGLKFPEDLSAWREWQQQADGIRKVKTALLNVPIAVTGLLGHGESPEEPEPVVGFLYSHPNHSTRVLSVLDSASPTSISSLIKPLKHLDSDVAVWASERISDVLPGDGWQETIVTEGELGGLLPDLSCVLSLGHYMKFGAAAFRLARLTQSEFIVTQHGLITPYAPPLPKESTFLAFSEDDAKFYLSGRADVNYRVVGSQLFYDAAQAATGEKKADSSGQPIFLGQMHGAELPRASYAKAGYTFCKENNARYRPHPQEKDKLSVLTHRLWARIGIEIDESREPLKNLSNPVVSVFSTGVLEAAIRGVPAWVYHPNPPAWLEEFWDRYGMNRWGSEPTPAPGIPSQEPAQAIAQYIKERLS